EVFVHFAKHGSTLRGIMDAFAISVSHGLQYGVPLKTYVNSMINTSFSPAGITDDPQIRTASSLVDYTFRKLALTYLSFDDRLELGLASIEDMPDEQVSLLETGSVDEKVEETAEAIADNPDEKTHESPKITAAKVEKPRVSMAVDDAAPLCFNCGNQTQRAGSCYVCTACGSTTGCS